MIRTILVIVFLLCTGLLLGQTNDKKDCVTQFDTLTGRTVYLIVDSMPEFPGGTDSLMKFMVNNYRWPKDEADFQGTIYISFIVEPDGSLTNKRILRGIYNLADEEALRVIDIMPKWIAGKCNGIAVPVRSYLPMKIHLY